MYYRPTDSNSNSVGFANESAHCLKYLCRNSELVCIMGDFNLPGINWRDYSHPNNEIYNVFINFLDEIGFHQFVQLPTRQANILDLLPSNDACFISDIKIMPPICQTDHNTIVFKANLPSQPITIYGHGSRRLTQSAYENLNNYYCEISWNDLITSSEIMLPVPACNSATSSISPSIGMNYPMIGDMLM